MEVKVCGEPHQVCRTKVNSVPECCRSPYALLDLEKIGQLGLMSADERVRCCMKSFVLVGAWKDASTCEFRVALWPCSSPVSIESW